MDDGSLLSHLAFGSNDGRDWGDIGYRLIGEFEIFLDVGGVLDLCPDDRCSNDQRSGQKTPIGSKLGHVRDLVGIEDGRKCTTSGLDTFVEASKVRQFAAVVGERAHKPINVSQGQVSNDKTKGRAGLTSKRLFAILSHMHRRT